MSCALKDTAALQPKSGSYISLDFPATCCRRLFHCAWLYSVFKVQVLIVDNLLVCLGIQLNVLTQHFRLALIVQVLNDFTCKIRQ